MRPGHVRKLPVFIALMKVDVTGLKQHASRNFMRLEIVVLLLMTTLMICLDVWGHSDYFVWVWKVALFFEFWDKGISHKPSLLFRKPCNTKCSSFQTSKCVFVKTILQSSSHKRPSEINDALFKSLKTCAIVACWDKCRIGSRYVQSFVCCLVDILLVMLCVFAYIEWNYGQGECSNL